LEKTGYEEIGLLSLSSADHSEIAEIAKGLADRYENTQTSLSLPSTRVDAFNIDLANELSRNGRRSGLTFAPEGGSERIRKVINKMVTEEDLIRTVGRTEREVGRDIAEAILAAGHVTVDFVIVASGPNGASPHHELSDRVIEPGDPVVVDIGGTMASGYCSDCTRMYVCGQAPAEYLEHYEVLLAAQEAARAHARPGVTCESVDAAARDILVSAGLGDQFIHRTGHGIGMETHEEPYIVTGNKSLLVPGHAFSIEPGFYFAGKYGARIEDIVTCTQDGILSANNTSRELVIL
jgi:Xaa-Pro aminopeptidase